MTEAEQIAADVATCERALDLLLRAIIRHDDERAAARVGPPPIRLFAFEGIDVTRLGFEALTGDPVRHALRRGVRGIGRELYRLGGTTEAMLRSLYRVCDLDPVAEGRRLSITDHAWDGIGADNDRWWA